MRAAMVGSALLATLLHATAAAQPADGLLAVAASYEHGEGVPRDLPQAADLYCRAARLGLADGQYALGWMIANGRGLPRDDGAAWRLFALAAEQGHAQAARLAATLPPRPDAALPACLAPTPPLRVELAPDLPPVVDVPPGGEAVRALVARLAPQYDVDPALALAVIAVESGFRADAVSPKNAQGLMQLIPETVRRFAVADPFDPEANIRGGLAYLRWLLARFDGNVPLVAAAYNAGENAVLRHQGVPPYRETVAYVARLTRLYSSPVHRYYRTISTVQPKR